MKLSAGKKEAIKRNRASVKDRKKSGKRIRMLESDKVLILAFAGLFAVMAAFIVIKAATRVDVSGEVPQNYYKVMNNFRNETDDVEADPNKTDGMPLSMRKEPTPISCWGDSFTLAADEGIVSYAGVLSGLKNRTVYNIAAADDSLVAVAGRVGGIPLVVTPFIIPEDKTPVEIVIDNAEGERMYLDLRKNAGLNPCIINGIEGMISRINDKLYFTRSASGARTMITEPVEVETRGMALRRDDITVFFVGSDDMFSDPQKTVQVYKKMAGSLGNNDKYAVMSPVRGDRKTIEAVETALEAAFGTKFINTRKLLCENVEALNEVYPVSEDGKRQAANGDIPAEYFLNDDYFSEMGGYAVGSVAAEALEKMGYFTDAAETGESTETQTAS